jgi:hypothetical protein
MFSRMPDFSPFLYDHALALQFFVDGRRRFPAAWTAE